MFNFFICVTIFFLINEILQISIKYYYSHSFYTPLIKPLSTESRRYLIKFAIFIIYEFLQREDNINEKWCVYFISCICGKKFYQLLLKNVFYSYNYAEIILTGRWSASK